MGDGTDDHLGRRVLWGAAAPASAVIVVVLLVGVGWFVPKTYPPDARQVLPIWLQECRPEPLEQLRYVLAVAAAVLVLWGGAAYARRMAQRTGAAPWSGPWMGRWSLVVQW